LAVKLASSNQPNGTKVCDGEVWPHIPKCLNLEYNFLANGPENLKVFRETDSASKDETQSEISNDLKLPDLRSESYGIYIAECR
jgi:hypothetical protein